MPPSEPARFHRLAPGDLIAGRYRLVERLGEGGMGVVYSARLEDAPDTAPLVALKFPLSHVDTDADRLAEEAALAARIDSPHVVRILEFGFDSDRNLAFLAMQRVVGEPLDEVLEQEGVLTVQRTLDIMIEIARAVVAIHGCGIIHRDLKPSNIIVDQQGECRAASEGGWAGFAGPGPADQRRDGPNVTVLDFGVARVVGGPDVAEEERGMLVGTPRYMSPEQARGGATEPRSDLYALGCVLHELLTGEVPLPLDSLLWHIEGAGWPETPPLVLPALPDDVRDGLVALHRRLLDPEIEGRPASAEEVLGVLEDLRGRASGSAGARAFWSATLKRRRRTKVASASAVTRRRGRERATHSGTVDGRR